MAPFLQRRTLTWDFNFHDIPGEAEIAVEFMFPFPIQNAGLFTDAWTLERIGDLPGEECRGAPRIKYDRVYNVIPMDATEEQAAAIFLEGWRRSRETVGGSYDDAGIGDLDQRSANLYGIPEARRFEFQEFYADYYPGVSVIFKPMPGEPEPPFELPQPAELLSLHMQGNETGWDAFVTQVQPEAVKLVGEYERAAFIHSVSPHTIVVARYVVEDWHHYVQQSDKRAAAREFLDRFYPALTANHIDAAESLNEIYATYDPLNQQCVEFDLAFLEELEARGDGIKGLVGIAAVGNPHESEVPLLRPLAQACYHGGHYLGPHPYFPSNPTYAEQWLEEEGPWHHMRWAEWDVDFAAHGYYPMYLLGECGAIGASPIFKDGKWRPGAYVSAASGWKAQETLRADWNRYLDLLLTWRAQLMLWNLEHGNRCRGATIFTVKSNWTNFLLNEPELMALAQALTGD
jgi:hypothetical protein